MEVMVLAAEECRTEFSLQGSRDQKRLVSDRRQRGVGSRIMFDRGRTGRLWEHNNNGAGDGETWRRGGQS